MAEVFDFGLQQHKIKMDGKFFENNLFAVAGDTGRRLEVQLLDSDNLVQNTTGISLRLNADVAGQATYAEATLVDAVNGLYELDLPNGMLMAPGDWQFQWQIIGTNGEKLHSFAFTGTVGSNLSEGGTEATNFYLDYISLNETLKEVQEVQHKLGEVVQEGVQNQVSTLALPATTTRFNDSPSIVGGDLVELKLNIRKIGTATIKVIEKISSTVYKTILNKTFTFTQLGVQILTAGVDFESFHLKNGDFIGWRGGTAELGYSAGGNAFYASAEGGIDASQTFTPIGLTLDIGWKISKEGTIESDINYLKEEVAKPIEINEGDIQPYQTTFFEKSKNEFDKTKAKIGYYVNQANGVIVANSTHKATDYIEGYPSKKVISSQPIQRYAFYDVNKTFISGGLNVYNLTYPAGATLLVASSDSWDINTLQIEEGTTSTPYVEYGSVIPQKYLGYRPETEVTIPPFIGDTNKEYRLIGANIRTPLVVGGTYSLLNDAGHEPMGITSATIVGDELRIGMNFTAKKVISMSIMPHVSLMQEGYSVATTGGLSVHAVHFYKDGAHVPAKDVVINGGSFWFSGTFLV